MKNMFIFLGFVLILTAVYISLINTGNMIDVNYAYSSLADAMSKADVTDFESGFFKTHMSLSIYGILFLIGGIIAGAGTVYMFLSVQNEKVKAYRRELEKTAISGETNASRVDVLEAKIKTLEKAFNTVVDERTQLEVQIKQLNNEIDALNKNN